MLLAQCGQQPGLLRSYDLPLVQHRRMFFNIFADGDHVLAGSDAAVNFDGGVIDGFGVFNHHHTISAPGNHSPGGNPGGFSGGNFKFRRLPHDDVARNGQVSRIALAGAKSGCTLNRIAIYNRARKIR